MPTISPAGLTRFVAPPSTGTNPGGAPASSTGTNPAGAASTGTKPGGGAPRLAASGGGRGGGGRLGIYFRLQPGGSAALGGAHQAFPAGSSAMNEPALPAGASSCPATLGPSRDHVRWFTAAR